jgi:hypothetical protein
MVLVLLSLSKLDAGLGKDKEDKELIYFSYILQLTYLPLTHLDGQIYFL